MNVQMAGKPPAKKATDTLCGWEWVRSESRPEQIPAAAPKRSAGVEPKKAFLRRHEHLIALCVAAAIISFLVLGTFSLLQLIKQRSMAVAPVAGASEVEPNSAHEFERVDEADALAERNLAVALAIAHDRVTRAVTEPQNVHTEPTRQVDRQTRRHHRRERLRHEPPPLRVQHEPPPGLFGTAPVDRTHR